MLEALRGAEVEDRIRQAASIIYQALIEPELSSMIGAGLPAQRGPHGAARHRPKTITTTAGDLPLQIPKLRPSSFFPGLLERWRRVDQSLVSRKGRGYSN